MDFRDVHAVSLDTVYLMAAAQDTARIYKTTDRGAHWTLQFDDTRKGMFLDAIAFFDATHGLAVGDPMDGRFVLLRTDDGGAHWTPIDSAGMPRALPGEAAFAASGTALVTAGAHDAWIATGGASESRVFHSRDGGRHWTVVSTPVRAGVPSAGIFSLAFRDAKHGIAVGGDYAHPNPSQVTVAYTADGGATWTAAPPSSATGYLSGVAYCPGADGRTLIGVGTQGTALSRDGGATWTHMNTHVLNVVMPSADGKGVWAAGPGGTVATFAPPPRP
jgi:photosystem II stability/assembly factor-like uncharacterized protein